jgi:hypothetical protein
MTNRKSIFPLQPAGGPSPKSGVTPRSSGGSEVDSPPVLLVDPSMVEVDASPAPDDEVSPLVPSGAVVTGGLAVNPDVPEPGAWQAASKPRKAM